jgi:hypothetical protein
MLLHSLSRTLHTPVTISTEFHLPTSLLSTTVAHTLTILTDYLARSRLVDQNEGERFVVDCEGPREQGRN